MKCSKCNGLMIYERYQFICEVAYAWRCVICGEIIDNVVLSNREQSTNRRENQIGTTIGCNK